MIAERQDENDVGLAVFGARRRHQLGAGGPYASPMASSPAKRFAEIGSDKPPAGSRAGLGTAIVLGGSVAGMLAARVLADHAETVVIIERDLVSAGADGRRGVPQSSQVHALLSGGSRQLERWFPGFIARSVAAGASLVPPERQAMYTDGVRKVRGADISLLSGTRPFLEGRIRTELLELPNVKVVTGQVTGLEIGETAVAAVRYESGGVAGREPAGEEVGGAVFSAVEGDRWIAMMGGYGDFRPGSTAADMIRRFRTQLPAPFGHVAANEMAGGVTTYRQADSRRRDFWACERLPARDFLALQRVIVDAAWQISASKDRSGAGEGDRMPVGDRLARRIVDLIIQASVTDSAVNAAFQEVTQMLRHPSTLAGPRVVWRAWRARKNPLPAPTPPLG